jgi:hypothetical protein
MTDREEICPGYAPLAERSSVIELRRVSDVSNEFT